MPGTVADARMTPCGYQQITSLSSATALTIPTGVTGSVYALIQATTQNVRWRDDGTNPTASVGMQLLAGSDMWYVGSLTALKFIEETASAKLNISYYKPVEGV